MARKKKILHLAGRIQGLAGSVLHLNGAILAFGHPILKFTIIKQFNAQEWCRLADQLTRFMLDLTISNEMINMDQSD